MRSLFSCLVVLLALSPLACADEDEGLSVDVACDAYSDKAVECLSDDPLNDDNIKAAATTNCVDGIGDAEAENPDNRACHQAIRRFFMCSGTDTTCTEFETGMYMPQTCESEVYDVLEFCDNFPFG